MTIDGRRYRESTGTADREAANRKMLDRIAELRTEGAAPPANLTIADVVKLKLEDEKRKGLKDQRNNPLRWKPHLEPFFGKIKVRDLTAHKIVEYGTKRREEGVSDATVNRELSIIRRSLFLAFKRGSIRRGDIPFFDLAPENNVRRGFIRPDQYKVLSEECGKVNNWLKAFVSLAYTFGWRKSEVQGLRVGQVDFVDNVLRLHDSKSGDPRSIIMTKEVRELLLLLCKGRKSDEPIFTVRDIRKAWFAATKAAKMPDLLFHDLRRSGVRNMRRAGVTESVAMKISGHRTSHTFRRYDITSEEDLKDATKKLEGYYQNTVRVASSDSAIQAQDTQSKHTGP